MKEGIRTVKWLEEEDIFILVFSRDESPPSVFWLERTRMSFSGVEEVLLLNGK